MTSSLLLPGAAVYWMSWEAAAAGSAGLVAADGAAQTAGWLSGRDCGAARVIPAWAVSPECRR